MAQQLSLLVPGYQLRRGSTQDWELLLQFMQRTYQEFYPGQSFDHFEQTLEQFFSHQTPVWWVEPVDSPESVVGCVWVGRAVDQVGGDRQTHIFLLYVAPEHRRQGIGSALMRHVEAWAKTQGDRSLGLQVFQANQAALAFYRHLGYETQFLGLVKPVDSPIP